MYKTKEGILTQQQADDTASFYDMSTEEYAAKNNWKLQEGEPEGEPGKTKDPVQTANAGSETMTAGGDSISADTSLEQSETFDLNADLQSIATAGGFKGDETEGRKRLEGYFKNVEGLSFDEVLPGLDYVQAIYTDSKTGKKVKSDRISFDTKNEKAIADNIERLSSFVNNNISQESLAGIAGNAKELATARAKEIKSFVTPKKLAEINDEYNNPELFAPKYVQEAVESSYGDTRGFQGVTGTREVQVLPYEAELKTATEDILKWAKENNANLSNEDVTKGAEEIVRGTLKAEALLDVKQDAAKVATKESIDKEGDQFIGDVFLQRDATKRYDALVNKTALAKTQVEVSARAYNNLAALTKGELSMEEQERLSEDLSALGIVINSDNQNIVKFKDGTEMPEEYYNALATTSELYDASSLIQKREQNKSADAAAEIKDINIAMDASRRSYDLADKSLNTIATGAASLIMGAAEVGSYINPLTRLIAGEDIDEGLIQAQKGIDATRELYQRDVTFEKAFSDAGNFGEFMLQEVSTQIPILVAMIASGGAASAVVGVTSAGEKAIQMKTSNLEGSTDFSEGEILLKSAGYGVAESAFAQITTTRILKNIKLDLAGAGKTTLLNNGTKAWIKAKSPALLFEPIAESLGEIGTTGAQNLIDGVPIITGMDHSAFSGYAMGLAMQAIPFVHGGYISRFSDYNAKAKIREKQTLVNSIGQELAAEKDPLKRVELEQQYAKENKELTEEIEKQESLVNNNVRADFAEVIINITTTQSELQTQAAAIQNDPNLSVGQKKAKLAPLLVKFNGLQAIKESSLSTRNMQRYRPEFDLLEVSDKARYESINAEALAKLLAEKGTFSDPTALQIKSAAYEIFLEQDVRAKNAQAGKVEGSKLRQFETKEEAIAAIESGEIIVADPESVIENIKEGAHGFSITGGVQGAIVEAQVRDQLRNVATHEIGHSVTDKILKNNPVKAKTMATGVLSGLKNMLSDAEYKEFLQSATVDNKVNDDEVLMRFLEMVADDEAGFREIKEKRNLLGLFGATMQKEFAGEYDFDFKGETDIFNFFVGLGKKIASGELTLADIESASQNEIFNSLEAEEGTAQADGSTKLSSKGKSTVLEAINALVPEEVTTKAEFQNRKVFNAVYAATEPGGAISNYVRSKSESKEVADKAMESVVDRLINYDPAAARKKANGDPITFGEFIFANTNFGKLDARKSLAIEAKETARKVSIDSEQAKEIADKDTTADPRATSKPKRMNLVTRGVVSTEAISKARKTVERAVGALKVPFDSKTSLNVTVKPYIAALKKGFAEKELVKAVAQDMGNGGDLKSWMRKHKAAILDNMTTTYLIGAFPAAIQKQVKGTDTWTSDWAGKEIQREKTTTANAGRTSGAFMVRRLPNAASKISDADFAGMLFDSNGVIKPGKKPSLAKAIAEEIGFDILSAEIQNPDGAIAEAFKDNQSALGAIVLSNTVATLNKDAERGSAKFSINAAQRKEISDKQGKFVDKAIGLNMNLTQNRIAGVMREVYNSKIFNEEQVVAFAKEAWVPVKRYIDQIARTVNVNLAEFIQDGIGIRKIDTNVMIQLGLTNEDIPNGYKALFENKNLIDIQRSHSFDFVAKLLKEEGAEGLMKALKYMRGHQTSAGKVGDGRMQIYAGNQDYIDNNLNIHPGVDINYEFASDGKLLIKEAKYIDPVTKKVTVLEGRLKPPTQKSTPTREKFIEEFDEREKAAKEAQDVLIDFLAFIKKEGTPIDWVMTMMSLKSNMESMLKSAAAVKYYYVGPKMSSKELRYEHMLSTEFMVQKLTEHFYIKPLDLKTLFSKYKVAIIPIKMDDSINVLRQTSAGADFDFMKDPETKRYYGIKGYANIVPIETLGGKNKGDIVGEGAAKLSRAIPMDRRVESEKRTEQDIASNKASAKFSVTQETDMSKAINDMIERNKGVQSEKVFSAVQAKKRGKTIGKYKFFSPAADDFRGLTSYTFAGKGKQGEADQKFFEDKLIKPYQRAINAIDVAKQTIKNDYAAIVKAFEPQAKIMRNKIPNSDYTYDQAIRVYMWTRQGTEVPGMSKRDLALLNKTISQDPDMIAFADAMLLVSKQGEWMAPSEHWLTNTVLSDLNNMSEKVGRKVYLEEFLAAKDIIFSPENLAKIEAAYGSKYVSALKDSLYRMENGTNRPSGDDATTNRWLNWINQSTGAIMFFNRRSAALQLLSTVNFINWSDNNPVKAAMAFANQKQFWTDFAMLFNSPKLKQRRAGLKTDVTQAEIANAVAGQTNKAAAALNYLLKKGFTFTQVADAFAIASGGASFYRNRVNTYLKQGMSQNEAETLAFEEFSSTADESQQSSDPMLISQQQAGVLGRLVLAFQNTTMQYTRLMKKSTQDLINRRGDPKTNISKIIYYGAVQNFVFSALQSALFSFIPGFDDEDDKDKTREEKLDGATVRIINSMVDSILRGSGLTGAVISTLKNATMKYVEQEEKGYNSDHIYTFLSVMAISPPMGSKLSKLYKAQQTKTFEKDALAARPFGVVADGRVNLGPGYRIVGNLAAAVGSVPLDRIVDEVTSISEALDSRNTEWQRLALAIGWKAWAVGAKNEEHDLLKVAGKKQRDKDGRAKAAATRAKNKKNKPSTKARRR